MMLKAYKYRIYPSKEQRILIEKHFGCTRFIYNWALDKRIKAYSKDKTSLNFFAMVPELTKLKKELEWLKEVNSQSLQASLLNLDKAFTKFFKEKTGFPKFKKTKLTQLLLKL